SATDVAIESSSIILTRSTLSSLVTLITLSNAIIRRVRLNFLWAYLYNTLAIPIAAGVFFPAFHFALRPEIAGLAMATSSISVVLSSLWLRHFKEPLVPEVKTSSYGWAF
ncbi:6106_t:CDS:1, partial [Ambispora gerdemannii]